MSGCLGRFKGGLLAGCDGWIDVRVCEIRGWLLAEQLNQHVDIYSIFKRLIDVELKMFLCFVLLFN